MFNRRRYTSKTPRRRTFRRKVRRKGVILRPSAPQIAPPPKPEFDEASRAAPYMWQYCAQAKPMKITDSVAKIPSLKSICSGVVAESADALEPSFLNTSSWTCWKTVWRNICQRHLDSPYVFRMFAKHFGSMPDFKCHFTSTGDKSPRSSAISSSLLPVRSHRIDNVFSNISHRDFVAFLSGVDAHVIVDCSSLKELKREEVLNLCNASNLAGLDLSHNDWVDEQFLYTLGRAVAFKGLSKFKLLRLVNCPNLSKSGLLRFLQETQNDLVYIATDIQVLTESIFHAQLQEKTEVTVDGSQWQLLQAKHVHHNRLVKYKLATAAHYLSRNTELLNIPKDSVLWDIKLFQAAVDSRDPQDLYSQLSDSWIEREKLAMPKPSLNPFVYLKSGRVRKSTPKEPELKIEKPVLQESASILTKRVPQRKPTVRLKNTDKFFGIK